MADTTTVNWRKSSRSGNQGACVEVADTLPGGRVGVRDSKDPTGPVLTFSPTSWTTFTTNLPTLNR
ncbi:DUF397 domain-containing protein [Micromonospora sp. WMMD1082]|uniref:DUF397 domain-containing protein n=1 Tax=Micromonospora sp. WMMD1082 TaxID=3016104 RepID=UPI00241760A9|nr:DUF397 domain-containing protein [Micromonospora sp. WMMD1082]MDG4797645.1 DUF397 domain-containing protein [Micromonospora sp. WMMD1082]